MSGDLDPRFRPPPEALPDIRAVSERIIAAAVPAAHSAGYALATHGSLVRDVDLLAVPWTESALPVPALVEAVRCAVSAAVGRCLKDRGPPTEKPHGRLAHTLILLDGAVSTEAGLFPFIDLSVIPPRETST